MTRTILVLLGCALALTAQVTTQDLLNEESDGAEWLSNNGGYASWRHSRLTEVTPANAAGLQLKWVHQHKYAEKYETTPLVHDGVMYITTPPNHVYALDAASGAGLWHYERQLPAKIVACCGQVNRGLAIHGDALFMATLDAYAIALDRKTGRVLWETKMAEYSEAYSGTHAPLIVNDLAIVGVAGAEYGIRGFIDAFDIKTGERRWRFHTIPGEGEFGNDTWEGDSWKTGGGSIWVTPSYDPEANLIFAGIGNPGPDWNGDVRMGDNLFSASVVALDADTGKRKWHFQFTPHDVHDWDATQVMVLIDKELEGKDRKLLITANRNGFYYVLDRITGEYLLGKEFIYLDWATGLDEAGRPMRVPGKEPSAEGTLVYPHVGGATNWMNPTYSPITDLFYVTVREGPAMYYKGPADYRPGTRFWGSMFVNEGYTDDWFGAVRAFNPLTGEKVWEHKQTRGAWSGLMSTAGGVVFAGSAEGYFKALDAETGKDLWHINLGDRIVAAAMTYESKGRQLIAIPCGHTLFVFGLP